MQPYSPLSWAMPLPVDRLLPGRGRSRGKTVTRISIGRPKRRSRNEPRPPPGRRDKTEARRSTGRAGRDAAVDLGCDGGVRRVGRSRMASRRGGASPDSQVRRCRSPACRLLRHGVRRRPRPLSSSSTCRYSDYEAWPRCRDARTRREHRGSCRMGRRRCEVGRRIGSKWIHRAIRARELAAHQDRRRSTPKGDDPLSHERSSSA